MHTISALARRFGLARSTLLHYDKLGLLLPAGRSRADYRYYGEAEVVRLGWICTYRRAGLSLEAIARVLGAPDTAAKQALEQRLEEVDLELARLRDQQRVIADLLQRPELLERRGVLDKATWVELLRASGMSEEAMDRWHGEFERSDPERHQRFLEALGLGAAEIQRIRGGARKGDPRSYGASG